MDGTAGALTAPIIDGSVLAVELDQIEAEAAAFARAARAPATRRAYASDWADFTAWCRRAGLVPLPATPRTVGSYLAARAADLKVSTLQRRLAAIAVAHRLAGHRLERKDPAIGAVLAGIKRVKGTRPEMKAPLLTNELRQVLRKLPDDLTGARDRAILLIGFAGALRRSELGALDRGDVVIGPAGADVVIRRSKTDPHGLGQRVCIPRSRRSASCPVAALEAWLSAALIIEGPIFTALDRGHTGTQLSGAAIAQVIKRAVAAGGLDPALYGGHSLRAGFATSGGTRRRRSAGDSRPDASPIARGGATVCPRPGCGLARLPRLAGNRPMKPGARARIQLCDMRRELVRRLDRSLTGDNIALLGSIQACITAIDCTFEVVDVPTGQGIMQVSEQSYTEIFENLSQRGYEHVLVGENGEIDLKGVRLIQRPQADQREQ